LIKGNDSTPRETVVARSEATKQSRKDDWIASSRNKCGDRNDGKKVCSSARRPHRFNHKPLINSLTQRPGIYKMLNEAGEVLYVGKARNLKNRVASYFRQEGASLKVKSLVEQIAAIEVIVTHTENEALLLENNLIKQLKPRYNILLRDDKSYPYIFIESTHTYPRMAFFRGKKPRQGHCFGPYPSASVVRESIRLLQKIFRIRQCDESFFRHRTRPCLQYQMNRCTAPCVGLIDAPTYQQSIRHAILFLQGKSAQVIDEIRLKMQDAVAKLAYEKAAMYRDQMILLRQLQEKQAVMGKSMDADVAFFLFGEKWLCFQLLFIRGGHLLGQKSLFLPVVCEQAEQDLLSSLLAQYYLQESQAIPKKIILNMPLKERDWLASVLTEQAGYTVSLVQHARGHYKDWLHLAQTNAEEAMNRQLAGKSRIARQLALLKDSLGLEREPKRIDCFDVSHHMGECTVASCVVFTEKGPLKSHYRRFNIKGITLGDDYAAMQQALLRRYGQNQSAEPDRPDIILIDGGKGQLRQAEIALESLQISGVCLVGVAKGLGRKPGLETLFILGKKKSFAFSE
jgi:excinuclease ABC, C subunit